MGCRSEEGDDNNPPSKKRRISSDEEKQGGNLVLGPQLPQLMSYTDQEFVIQRTVVINTAEASAYLMKSLTLHHKNILPVFKFRQQSDESIRVAYSQYDYTLNDIIHDRNYFFLNGVTTVAPGFIKLLGDLVEVAIYVNETNLSHGGLSNPENIAYFINGADCQVHNFFSPGPGDEAGFRRDLRGIAALVLTIAAKHSLASSRLPVRLQSFISFLRSDHAARNPVLIKDHPLLLSIRRIKEMYVDDGNNVAEDYLFGEHYESRLLTRPECGNLISWREKLGEKYDPDYCRRLPSNPSYLPRFIRNKLGHLAIRRARDRRSRERALLQNFEDLFPNLLIEMFGNHNMIDYMYLSYS